jgi:hypothetical protein
VDMTWPVSNLRNLVCQLGSGHDTDEDVCGQNSSQCQRVCAFNMTK